MYVPDSDHTTDPDSNSGFKTRCSYVMISPHTPGKFTLRCPLISLFGFFENFCALRGYPLHISLVRGKDSDALLRKDQTHEGKFKFEKLTISAPIVDPSKIVTVELLKGLSEPKPYLYSFRKRSGLMSPVSDKITDFQMVIATTSMVERPQMVYAAFQRDKTDDQKYNHSLYWHANVETLTVSVNNVQFPSNPEPADFPENNLGNFYESQLHARENYLQYPSTYTQGNFLNPCNFRDLYTIFVVDVTKQQFTVGAKSVTTKIHVKFKAQTPTNLTIHIAWWSERSLELYSNGDPLNIKEHTDSFIA